MTTTGNGNETTSEAPVALAKPPAGQTVNDPLPLGQMVKALSESELVPAAYKGKPGNVLIAMDIAQRIGASAFAVMQNLDIIHGRPSWRASFLIATVNASGRFTPLRFLFEGQRGTPEWGCRAYATDKQENECVGALITMQMAKQEGWSTKSGSKWLTMPEQMLMYRAAAFWARVYCPELSLGIHTREEVEDFSDDVRAVNAAVSKPSSLTDAVMSLPAPQMPVAVPQPDEPSENAVKRPVPVEHQRQMEAMNLADESDGNEPPPEPEKPARRENPPHAITGLKRHVGEAAEIRDLLDSKRVTVDEFRRILATQFNDAANLTQVAAEFYPNVLTALEEVART